MVYHTGQGIQILAAHKDRKAKGALRDFRRQLGQDSKLLIPAVEATLRPGVVEALDIVEDVSPDRLQHQKTLIRKYRVP